MVELQYFEPSDFQQLIEWVKTPEFLIQWSGTSFQYPLNETQLEQYLEKANQENAETYAYKVVLQETGQVAGHISLGRIDTKNQSARIGRVLVGENAQRGKGIGQRMMKEILRVGFEQLHLHRISLGVYDFNHSAIACYEKAGFQKEGLLRDTNKVGDTYWSMWEISILDKEWRNQKS